MNKPLILIAIVVLAGFSSNGFAQGPKAAAEAFYKYDRSHSQAFNRVSIEARKRWFSPELYRLFQNELRREAAYLKKNPTDKPYFGDGLPFQPLDETCKVAGRDTHRSVHLTQDWQKGNRAVVTAAFAYPKGCAGADTVTYTIGMIRGKSGWLVDDVNYGEDTTLKQRLNRKEY